MKGRQDTEEEGQEMIKKRKIKKEGGKENKG